MNKKLLLLPALITMAGIGILIHKNGLHFWRDRTFKEAWLEKLAEGEKEEDEENPQKRAEMQIARWQYEFDILKDPKTGRIPRNAYSEEMKQAMSIPVSGESGSLQNGIISYGVNTPTNNVYLKAGPNNIGGRTRAFVLDKRFNGTTNRVIIAGCVSGGIMRSADGGVTWNLVTPSAQIHSLTTLAQDPRAGKEDTWYAGSGESLGNSAGASGAFFFGNGIFKSTDNGLTWTALTSTQSTLESFNSAFDIIHKIVVHPITGDIYVAGQNTIQRSKDGGQSWTAVKGTLGGSTVTGNTDVVIRLDGSKIYIAFHLKNANDRGVWESPTGDPETWTAIAGNTAETPTGFKQNTGSSNWGRVVMALAPSNNNILYVMYENGLTVGASTSEADLFKLETTGGTTQWTNLSAFMPTGSGNNGGMKLQGGYNMMVVVKPDDPNMVFVGGTNLYRSSNGFTTTAATTTIGGYPTKNSHPDMHDLVFDPTNLNKAYSSNDGSMQVTTDITAIPVVWEYIKNYQTLQYYHVTIDPENGKNNFMGGAQDNGTWYRDASLNLGPRTADRPGIDDHFTIGGGDGVAVDIANINAGKQLIYFGFQNGGIIRDEVLDYVNYPGGSIRPRVSDLRANSSGGWGDFVTYFKLSHANSEVLFYANYFNLFRTTSASTVDSTSWIKMTGIANITDNGNATPVSIRTIDFSWGPYKTTHAMFYGTSSGKIFRLDDYINASPATTPVDISPSSLSGNVIDIAVNPNDDNEIMAVVSNYGVTSIWWTFNAKSATPSWSNAEGNLTLPSIRSCVIAPKLENGVPVTEYYVGTSVGLFTTASIGKTLGAGGTITWSRESPSVLNYAVITSLDYRPTDNTLLIGTHGNGMYYTVTGTPNYNPNITTALATAILNDKSFINIFPSVSRGKYQYGQGTISGIKSMQVQVYNMFGQRVYNQSVNYGSGNISLEHLAAGNYLIQITSDNKRYQTFQKVIKQ
ncbi:MAG: T9SS type A sorting domain-containing protein [Sediminibacterium sp.]